MKKLLILILCLLLTGCASRAGHSDFAPGEENRLVVYTSHKEEVYRPIIREFEERTGIWVQVVTGGTSDLLERIAQEKAAPQADVMFGGGVESLDSYRRLFDPVQCREAENITDHLLSPDDPWIPFSALPVVLVYNTMLVEPGNLTGWADLQRPEFAGKIAMADPARSGSSFTALVTGLSACGDEAMRALALNLLGQQLDASREVLGKVADGSCLVGITLEETALQRIAAGDNLAMVYPTEGTSCVPDGTAVVLGAPHSENALRFLDFTLSRQVQQLLGEQFYRRSVRRDVTAPAALIPMDELVLVDYPAHWAVEHRADILQKWEWSVKEGAA